VELGEIESNGDMFDLWANHHVYRLCVYRRARQEVDLIAVFVGRGHLFGGLGWSVEAGNSLKLWSPLFSEPSDCGVFGYGKMADRA
jgi:hypothetical protein